MRLFLLHLLVCSMVSVWKLMEQGASVTHVGCTAPLRSLLLEGESSVCTQLFGTDPQKWWVSEVPINECAQAVRLEHNLGCQGVGPSPSGCVERRSSRLWNQSRCASLSGEMSTPWGWCVWWDGSGVRAQFSALWLLPHSPSGRAGSAEPTRQSQMPLGCSTLSLGGWETSVLCIHTNTGMSQAQGQVHQVSRKCANSPGIQFHPCTCLLPWVNSTNRLTSLSSLVEQSKITSPDFDVRMECTHIPNHMLFRRSWWKVNCFKVEPSNVIKGI